jgi:hypothetical protein
MLGACMRVCLSVYVLRNVRLEMAIPASTSYEALKEHVIKIMYMFMCGLICANSFGAANLKANTNILACSEEVNAFATLPADEEHLRQLRDDVTKYAKKEDIDGTKTLVAKEQLKHDKVR